jgi:hypothetical protein
VSLTVGHVLVVALMTALGAAAGRFIKSRSPRLRFLNEVARAVLFLLGLTAAVALAVWAPAPGIEKAGMAGLYIGAVYGMVASDPPRRRPTAPPKAPPVEEPPRSSTGGDA